MTFSGGPIFWLLLALGAVALFNFLVRFLEFRRSEIDAQDFIKGVINVLDSGNVDEALAICEETPSPIATVVATAVRNRQSAADALREAISVQVHVETSRLQRRLAVLAVIGQIAPLLGLLGTILGFVRTVLMVNGAEPVLRAAVFGGCLQALVIAALGLAVAIMVAIFHAALRMRFLRLAVEMEVVASEMFTSITSAGERGAAK